MLKLMTTGCLALLAALAPLHSAQAEPSPGQGPYPNRPIHLIVPFPAGAAFDAMARKFADGLAKRLGQPIVIDNKPGGGLIPATQFVAKADPDGYTLYYTLTQPYSMNQFFYKRLPYDPVKDFTPVGTVMAFTTGLQVPANSPYKTLKEFVAAAKASPDKLTYGSAGAAGQSRLAMDIFLSATGAKMLHIPYQGASPASLAMLSGQVDALFLDYGTMMPYIRDNKVRALAVNLPKRYPGLPDIPTFAEAGFADLNVPLVWTGVVAPPNLPPAITAKLTPAVIEVASSADMKAFGDDKYMVPMPGGPDDLRKLIQKDIDGWGGMIKKLNLTLD
jgi:tripartite-type tricarboxylate transporter receptor subunit TctC